MVKFVQNINRHILESITNGQKNSVFHEWFDSISGFLSASKSYGLLTLCTNFCMSLYWGQGSGYPGKVVSSTALSDVVQTHNRKTPKSLKALSQNFIMLDPMRLRRWVV